MWLYVLDLSFFMNKQFTVLNLVKATKLLKKVKFKSGKFSLHWLLICQFIQWHFQCWWSHWNFTGRKYKSCFIMVSSDKTGCQEHHCSRIFIFSWSTWACNMFTNINLWNSKITSWQSTKFCNPRSNLIVLPCFN